MEGNIEPTTLPIPVDTDFQRLPSHPKLVRGELENGLKYMILPNTTPPDRFYAYLEVHTGSLHENDAEQGIAHFVEHAVFNGTTKYPNADTLRAILGTLGMSWGSDTNAFTDFRETVYTFDGPLGHQKDGTPNLHRVLDILHELGFNALMTEESVDKERAAVLSEMAIRNTIEFRVEYQMYQQLYPHNLLSKRFPIGLAEQIEKWNANDLKAFYQRWYRPDNMTVHVVGPVDVEEVLNMLRSIFVEPKPNTPFPTQPVIPHVYTRPIDSLRIFQHQLVHTFKIMLTQLLPLCTMTTTDDLRTQVLDTIISIAIENRVEALEKREADPPFLSMEWDYVDSCREGCGINSFYISCRAKDWKKALTMGIKELCSLVKFGLEPHELKYVMGVFLKSSQQDAERFDTTDSEDLIEEYREEANSGNVIMDNKQEYQAELRISHTITLAEVNARIRQLLSFTSDYVSDPNSAGSVFICTPQHYTPNNGSENEPFGVSQEDITQVIQEAIKDITPGDVSKLPQELVTEKYMLDRVKQLKPHYVNMCTLKGLGELEVGVEAEMGKSLLWKDKETGLYTIYSDVITEHTEYSKVVDSSSGVVMMKLDNGIRVNYKRTDFEAKRVIIRILAQGGRALESPEDAGVCDISFNSMVDGGAGEYTQDQLSKYASLHGVCIGGGVSMNYLYLDASCSVTEGGLQKAFELMYLYLNNPQFDEKAFERVRKEMVVAYKEMLKDLDSVTYHNLLAALFDPRDHRFLTSTPEEVHKATIQQARQFIEQQMRGPLEVCIVGDFDDKEVEDYVLRYFGTLNVQEDTTRFKKQCTLSFASDSHTHYTHLSDNTERVAVEIAAKGPPRWAGNGKNSYASIDVLGTSSGTISIKSSEPSLVRLVSYQPTLRSLLHRVINNRLYNIIREEKGMTYAVGLYSTAFDFFDASLVNISLAPFPDKIDVTIKSVKQLLENVKKGNITQQEFVEAQLPAAAAARTNLHVNSFWIQLLGGVQAPFLPKDISTLAYLSEMCMQVTLEELNTYAKGYSIVNACVSVGTAGKKETAVEGNLWV